MKILLNFIKYFLIATGVYILFVFFEIGGSYIEEAGFLGGIQNTWYLIISHLTNLILFSCLMSILIIARKNSLKKSFIITSLTFIIFGPLLLLYSNYIETELRMNSIIIRMENILGEKFNEEELKEKRKSFGINEQYQTVKELNISIDSLDKKINRDIKDLERFTIKIPDSSLVSKFDSDKIHKYKLIGKKKEDINPRISKSNIQRLSSQLIQINFVEKKQREFKFEKYSRFLQLIMLLYLLILGSLIGNRLSDQRLISILAIGLIIMIIVTYFFQMTKSYYIDDSNLLVVVFYAIILIGLLLYFSLLIPKARNLTMGNIG